MIAIPEFLQECRFIRLKPRDKYPMPDQTGHFESDTNNYAIDSPILLRHIQDGGNYGVLLRNGVCVIDCDSTELWQKIPARWKVSHVVASGRAGGGKHLYLRCNGAPAKKFVFHGDLGDVRFSDSHIITVGPGSIHPTGATYRYVGGNRLVEVSWQEMKAWIEANGGTVEKAPAAPRATPPEAHRRAQTSIPDSEVIRLVCLNSDRASLFYGDTSAHGGDDSAADLALCNHLAHWTGRDALQMDSVFRQSRLMRPKWDEMRGKDTYGNMTISKAIAGTMNVYTPPDYAHGAEVAAAFLEKDAEKEAATEAVPPRVKAKVDIEAAPHLIETIPGILQQHADYVNATNPEAQNQFAIASALLVGGAAMARRFKTDRGNPASIIILLIDKSSRGKKAPVEAIGDALAAANMTTTYQRGLWQSRQAIGSRLLFNAKPMVCHNEVGGLIGQASNGSGKSIKDLFDGINDLWDSPRLFNCPIYSAQGMRRAGMKADADTSVFRPVVNIAMSCTEDDLFREVKSPLISSGTVPRWTVVVGDGGGRRDDFAPMEYPPQVGAWLRDVSGHTEANDGAAVMTSGGEQVQIETPLPIWEKPKTDPEGKEIIIPITEGARKLFTESRDRQREVENDLEFSRIEQVDVLFGKVTEKAMRTALIIAISIAGENYRDAVIDEMAAEWALCWEWYHARKFAVRIGAKMADTEFRALTVRVYDFLKRQVDADGFYKAVPEGILINRVRLNAHPGRVRNEVFQAVLTDFEGAIIRTPSTVRGKPVTFWQYVGEAAP